MGGGPPSISDLAHGKLAHETPAPEAPAPRNIGQETTDTLNAQLQLQPQIFAANQQYGPQYAQLYQQILSQGLFGQNGQGGGLLDTYQQATPQLGQIQATANTQQRQADITDVQNLGGQAVSAFNNANPQLAAIRAQMGNQQFGGAGMISPTSAQPVYNTFSASPYDQVTAGPNASADAYNQRALSDLSLGGQLGQQETRGITNDVLSRFNRAGRANDPTAIANTALGLDQAQQARLAQRQAAVATGAGLTNQQNQLGVQAQGLNQGAGLQLQGYGLQSQLANQQAGQQTSLANQNDVYRTQLANQQTQLANEQLRQQQLMQQAQFLQNSQIDPFQAILGRSGSLNNAMGVGQQASAGAGYTGSSQFDPFNGYASDLYNTNFNSASANNISGQNNQASQNSAMIGGGVSILAAFL